MKVSHHDGHSGFWSAGFRIAFVALESENAKVAELSGKVSLGALGRLNSRIRGAHLWNYS